MIDNIVSRPKSRVQSIGSEGSRHALWYYRSYLTESTKTGYRLLRLVNAEVGFGSKTKPGEKGVE
jgi:hypothetical protein